MASSGNFCTLNPLAQQNAGTYSENNLLFTHTASSWKSSFGTHGMKTGKWYWEAYQYEDISGNGFPVGIYDFDSGKQTKQAAQYPAQANASYGTGYVMYSTGQKRYNNTETSTSLGSAVGLWQCAFDADAGKIWFGKDNTWADSGNPAGGSSEAYASIPSSTWMPITCSYNDSNSENFPQNFGQDSTFSGRISVGGNADDNGFGDFKYSPPTGFLALCSGNLPVSDDIDPAQTSTDYPGKQFGVVLYTGDNSTSNAITGLDFQPDLVWIKARDDNNSYSNALFDTTRGRAKSIFSDNNRVENTSSSTQDLVSFDSDGFTVGTSYNTGSNLSGKTHVGWCWKANGAVTSTNSDGNINTTIQNRKGFSILTYGGSGGTVSGANPTIGHGLGATPDFFIIKNRSATDDFFAWHNTMAANQFGLLNSSNAPYNNAANAVMSNTLPSSSVITIANDGDGYNNTSSENYVCYAWCDVEGMQKFGRYLGNADNDGPFIYTGFRPRLIMIKQLEQNGTEWGVYDTARCTNNPNGRFLFWNGNNVENDGESFPARALDVTSNGFKIKDGSSGMTNNDDKLHMYAAFGDVPFRYNNTF